MTAAGIILAVVAVAAVIAGSFWRRKIILEEYEKFREPENSYTLFIKKHDWGCAVDKVIINAGECTRSFTQEDFDAEKFSVNVTYNEPDPDNGEITTVTKPRIVTEAYFCDIEGDRLEDVNAEELEEAPHIAIEFISAANDNSAKPFEEAAIAGNVRQKELYDYEITHEKFMQPINNCYDWIQPAEE